MKWKLKLSQLLKSSDRGKYAPDTSEVLEALKLHIDSEDIDPENIDVKRASCTYEPSDDGQKRLKFADEPALKNDRTFGIIATTPHMDRDREVVLSKGIDLSEWRKSGAILDSHDYNQLPIGKAVWIGQGDEGIKLHVEAAPTDRGEELLMLSKFMNLTASIGFIPTEIVDKSSIDFPKLIGKLVEKFSFLKQTRESVMRVIKRSIMLETSIVSVPANPNAIMEKAHKAAEDGLIDSDCLGMVIKQYGATASPGEPQEPQEPQGDKGIDDNVTVSKEWLEENGFELKEDGQIVRVENVVEPVQEPKVRDIKVIQRQRHIKVLSNPEQEALKISKTVSDVLDLALGGV